MCNKSVMINSIYVTVGQTHLSEVRNLDFATIST